MGGSNDGGFDFKKSPVVRQDSISSLQTCDTSSKDGWKDNAPDSKATPANVRRRPWRMTWLRFGPLSGIVAMLLAALALIASLGVLAGSDGQNVKGWNAPPSTYIAIFTAIANVAVRYAVTQGVIITWWRTASTGTTISRLHSDWRKGTTLRGAIAAGHRMGLLGLACVFSTIVVIDGPLLQRASTVMEIANPAIVSLNFTMALELPRAASGTWFTPEQADVPGWRNSFALNSTVPTPKGPISNLILTNSGDAINHVVSPWYHAEPIKGAVQGCPGDCLSKIQAPALFPTSCINQTYPVDNPTIRNITLVQDEVYAAPFETDVILIISTLDVSGRYERINLLTGYTTFYEDFKGDFHLQSCMLESGIGEYDILIQNNEIMMTSLSDPTLVALANNTAVDHTWINGVDGSGGHPSILGGVVNVMQAGWETYISCVVEEQEGQKVLSGFGVGQEGIYQFQTKSVASLCSSYRDSHDAMLKQMNKLMFYLGAKVAEMNPESLEMDARLQTNATGTGYVQGNIDVYHTDYWFFFGAAFVEVLCLALIAPTYFGFWRLGRPMTFSPIEMAKAFRSPLLADYNSNSSGRDLQRAAAATGRPIQYGVLMSESHGDELAFGDPNLISRPSQGLRFDR